MNRGLKIALFIVGTVGVAYLVYHYGFKNKKSKESGGNDLTSPIVYDKKSREIVLTK